MTEQAATAKPNQRHKTLGEALVAAQRDASAEPLVTNKTYAAQGKQSGVRVSFAYADAEHIAEWGRGILNRHGLAFTAGKPCGQAPIAVGEMPVVPFSYALVHEAGERMDWTVWAPLVVPYGGDYVRGLKNSSTGAMRYAIMDALCVRAEKDDEEPYAGVRAQAEADLPPPPPPPTLLPLPPAAPPAPPKAEAQKAAPLPPAASAAPTSPPTPTAVPGAASASEPPVGQKYADPAAAKARIAEHNARADVPPLPLPAAPSVVAALPSLPAATGSATGTTSAVSSPSDLGAPRTTVGGPGNGASGAAAPPPAPPAPPAGPSTAPTAPTDPLERIHAALVKAGVSSEAWMQHIFERFDIDLSTMPADDARWERVAVRAETEAAAIPAGERARLEQAWAQPGTSAVLPPPPPPPPAPEPATSFNFGANAAKAPTVATDGTLAGRFAVFCKAVVSERKDRGIKETDPEFLPMVNQWARTTGLFKVEKSIDDTKAEVTAQILADLEAGLEAWKRTPRPTPQAVGA